MSETQAQHVEGHEHGGHHTNYKKIYFTLLALLVVSVLGPFAGILIVTLITAFGIAVVKASMVIRNFMHLKDEKRLMVWMLTSSLILMALMFAGLSVDILNHEGRNWENLAARAAIERGIEGPEGAGEEGGEAGEVGETEFSAATTFGTVCAACHGRAGDGTGAAAVALDPKPANFTDPVFWETRDRDRILNVITDGAQAVFGGSAQMVPFRESYSAEQIQELTDYVMEFRPE